ncbi:helix-turn-helix transcriptional regulator [Providencia vermicola]|uniref:Helix-turn-helix transcriptional regulator n=3 Tax=Providencia TaxID=586 RepID=A0AAI9MVP3_PROST|nr:MULTISPECIES: AraC family transcriptional regulator [Providencia]ELR5035141.1 helix-turn-helix transcriptional regulator [Providencia stuartii]ELR5141030.1 helix-turn-helix transcriptional regulator [Providencia stuartii]ELR5290428.1 helix-turn-helix transcriptional regulator [Providencia stuartii]ELX8378442.1 helix-turn-helix transcriptional regulator [Providencia stuartii]EMD5257649.1 helix-turn-helix transcriptional regulator [Providencia stuartii]
MQNDNNVTDCRIKRTAINKNSSYSIIERPTKGLLIIEKGTLIWESPTTIEMLHPGDILYHQQGSYALKTLDYESECEFLSISLEDQFLREFMNHYGSQLSEIERSDNSSHDVIKFTTSAIIDDLKNSFKNLIKQQCPPLLESLRISEFLLLLSYSEQGSQLLSNLRQLTNRQAERLQNFMENNFLKEWKLAEFAKTFGMGLTTFKELFNTVYSTSPRSWISEKRIMYAHQLLINTQMSIVEISMEAGFSSQSYFTQSYRKRFGFTPSKSRS